MRSKKLCNMMCLTIPSLFSRYDSSSKTVFVFVPIFDDLEGGTTDDDDTEPPDPVQAQIPSHPGIKYPVRGILPSDKPPLKGIEVKGFNRD